MRKRGSRERPVRVCEFLRVGIFGMGQREFADMIGLSQQSITRYEHGGPREDEKFPFFALRNARRYALANGIAWPRGFADKLLDEGMVLEE